MQTSFLDINIDAGDKHNWFEDLMSILKVSEKPGWPDDFGSAIHHWVKNNTKLPIKTLSLFSGGGGLDIAFHDAGFDIVEMVELESKYAETLQLNFGSGKVTSRKKVTCIDIREYVPSFENEIDFIIGGPPCQTFSAAARRAAGVLGTDDPRGTLFEEYVRLLELLKPKGFLFENVYGIIGAQGGSAWNEIKQAFQRAGYGIYYRILDAADYGVPQHRERLFIVGLRSDSFKFPRPTHGPDSKNAMPFYTSGEAVRDVSLGYESQGINGKYGNLLNDIPPGLNYSFYTREMGHPRPIFGWRSKFSDFLYKADPERPVRTIKAQGGQYTGPFSWENRPFTVNELKRLQTFPDNYTLLGGRLACIEQIGNSVPPQMGRILALSILDQVFDVTLPIEVDYLEDYEELTFRQRKRLLTTLYATKAADAIQKLYSATPNHSEVIESVSNLTYERYLSEGFAWKKEGLSSDKVILNLNLDEHEIHIASLADPEAAYQIIIFPSNVDGWLLPQQRIILSSSSWKGTDFIGLWKALEEIIGDKYGIGDLVQLNGYYQYTPKFSSKLQWRRTPPALLWHVLQSVVSGMAVSRVMNDQELARAWHIARADVLSLLHGLRGLGYEVRSHNTNPQISEGGYIIPYAFPTLTPKSVQLNKTLESKQ